jgi:hypothetical protein
MKSKEQSPLPDYGTDDYIPGTDVLAIETRPPEPKVSLPPDQPGEDVVRDATPGAAIPDDPVTDRNGRVPNPPTASPP